jgi:hypothetical protein
MRRHENQKQTHKHRNNASPIPKEQAPQEAQKGKKALNFDANAKHAREPRPPVEVHQHRKHRNNATNAAKEERRCGAARRHETLVETQAPDHTATTAPRKKGDHHSPMKHSKRRMLGTYGQGRRPFPTCSRLASRCTTALNSRKNARGEQKCEKNQRLYSAEMQSKAA